MVQQNQLLVDGIINEMTKQFDELDDAFNVTSEIVPTENSEVGITKPERHVKTDIEKDYDYTRTKYS